VYVLDSYALLAYLEGEPGMPRVREILDHSAEGHCVACLSLINLGEVLYITERESDVTKAQEVLAAVEQLPIEILPASRDAVLAAAHIKARSPVSYADAFAIAAAEERGGTILTGDPEFGAVAGLVSVEWLPGKDG
jgi:ribonuclease VapC